MKRFLKGIVVALLARQVRLLRARHDIKIVGVVGGIGKTSTKAAIAALLGTSLRVRYQDGNYNDILSVPLVFFGHSMPSLLNPFAWFRLFLDNAAQIAGEYPYDVVVVELGTDRVGQIAEFKKYLHLDYAVVTALVPEHMAYFRDMQAVADEELSVMTYADKVIYNADLVDEAYRAPLSGAVSYGIKRAADYHLDKLTQTTKGFEGTVNHNGATVVPLVQDVVSDIQLYSALAAVSVGAGMGLSRAQLLEGIAAIRPVKGRLRRLRGIHDSLIIDDTYNAIPDAVALVLRTLYGLKAPHKIVILGSMNQLGATSPQAHADIGRLCDPKQLDLVVTFGHDANTYLAPAALAQGCRVESFRTPHEAGDYVATQVKKGAIILAKGSEAGVYAEEALKPLLADPADVSQLVRQSPYWAERKRKSFE
jgi:UDP-N-acetylmuramoyl-tripeptide--D-alanyl-D-alanine ligase